jgi:hypothetical protein
MPWALFEVLAKEYRPQRERASQAKPEIIF